MIKVGLTGGIGSGKTTVARLFELLGIPVYFADKEAKRLMHTHQKLRIAIRRVFGDDIYKDGSLNTSKLAEIVFQDGEALSQLNALVHPVVRADFVQWTEQQKAPYVIEESAILFETGLYKDFDYVVSILCPMEERIKRLLERDSITKKQIQARMAVQVSDAFRKEKSDYLLKNGKDDLLLPQVFGLDEILRNKII